MSSNNTRNKKTNNTTTKSSNTIQSNGKVSIVERFIIKRVIKKAEKKLKEYIKKAEFNLNERIKIETALLEISKTVPITDDETNEELNKENIKKIREEDLLNLFEEALKQLKKEI